MAINIGLGLAAVLRAEKDSIPLALNHEIVSFTNEVKVLISRHGEHPYWSYHAVGGRHGVEFKHIQLGSLPGEPPAVDTGDYRASWTFRPAHRTPFGWEAESFTPMELGVWLEYGTRHMAPRPHARVIAERKEREIPIEVEAVISAAGHRRAVELGGH